MWWGSFLPGSHSAPASSQSHKVGLGSIPCGGWEEDLGAEQRPLGWHGVRFCICKMGISVIL